MDMSTSHLVVMLLLLGFSTKALCDVPVVSECDFEDPSVCNFVQDTNDDIDWTRTSGETPSSNTGPSFDHTYGTSQGYYMYIEATGQSNNAVARIWTRPYATTKGLCIRWFYHMYGDTVDTLNVYVVDSTHHVGSPVWTRTNNQGNIWRPGKVSVAAFGVYQIMFEGIRGSSHTSDIGLDDVKITNRACSIQDISQCDFEDPNICNFVQDSMDDFDWTRKSGSTGSTNTGPSYDHTLGVSQGGYYLYVEATGQRNNDIARLWTPKYPATNGLCIEWFYHMYGDTVNTLNVYLVDSTGTVGAPVWTKTNNQGDIWLLGEVSVAVFGIYQIMFEGIIGSQYTSDIALDDITITSGGCLTQRIPKAFAKCDFEDPSICNFVQDTRDDFDWRRRSASTPSANTGPSFDHTHGTCQGGYYLYIEATGQSSNDIARLWTPSYPATNGLCIEWFYHMYGDSVNTLNVYVVDSSGNVGSPLWTRTNNQGNFWILGQISVTTSGIYQIMFEGIRGNDFTGDISLDDVTITSGACAKWCSETGQ